MHFSFSPLKGCSLSVVGCNEAVNRIAYLLRRSETGSFQSPAAQDTPPTFRTTLSRHQPAESGDLRVASWIPRRAPQQIAILPHGDLVPPRFTDLYVSFPRSLPTLAVDGSTLGLDSAAGRFGLPRSEFNS